MSPFGRTFRYWVVAGLVAGPLLLYGVLAQEKPAPASRPEATAAASAAARKSPVELFRELLALEPTERETALAQRPPEKRELLAAKLQEYDALEPGERELRLRVTELRWYLWPLMNTPATNRTAQLAAIPIESRKLVAAHLQQWDKLPAKVQKEVLESEAVARYFTRLMAFPPDPRDTLENLSAAERERLEAGIRRWQQMSEEQRQHLTSRFTQFFDLTPEEKAKALNTLSEPERRQLEKTLQTFGRLSADQRADCVRSFEKFASLSLAERQQFLKNAERWKLMSPAERQAWKDLVYRLASQPPLPPGWKLPPMPPMPPGFTPGGK